MIWQRLFIYGTVMPSVLPFINAQNTSIIKAGENNLSSEKEVNCTEPSFHDFPKIEFPGGPVVSTLITFVIIIYLFAFLARICDRYLVTAIKTICYKMHLSSDVAGATLMAAALSSPDLFVNLVGTFVTEGDIGIGTVVGCGVFNSLALPALCIFLSPAKVIRLDFYPLTRDCFFYCIAIVLLHFSLNDGRIEWYEALVLLCVYVLYLLVMSFNHWFRQKCEFLIERIRKRGGTSENSWPLLRKNYSTISYGIEEDLISMDQIQNIDTMQTPWKKRTLPMWLVTLPIDTLLYLTIPRPRSGGAESKLYIITFLTSVAWIGVICYLISWMITVTGFVLRIPDSLLGLTFIAIGMSIPEGVSSIIVAKQGHGSMALSNSMGANNFDVLVCLGLPWLLKATYDSSEPGHYLIINSHSLSISVLFLLTALFILYFSLTFNKFRLDKTIGWICSILYISFFIISCLLELNVFFEGNLPLCVS
ncbi:sodium/potassium/calcium exchanger 3 isoform X2 [Halyomorpha halys]|nr:sodium/potassium/calcium exchanger 3-like isoform X2 [Halyomorpha halys]XP_024216306.1 sodium/potassium/calcium exchanger 3-like isoform X2 [Halyomorpha halys]XP_024216307.1 sodium/potassium/calcium exchanger 3-like isoform X2 [Halyomorpha halys]XP_024216308.1 sodium/potassium/calcium exchanger 3-like isoform X2 [Halyomorpha halys]